MKTRYYLHSNKENSDLIDEVRHYLEDDGISLTEDAEMELVYTGYEVVLYVEVDVTTGKVYATHLNYMPLVDRVEI